MKHTAVSLLLLLIPASAPAADLTARQLLDLLDKNMVFQTRVSDARMSITKDGKTTEKQLHIQSKGYDTAFVDFLAPPRDKGTRYLKLDKNLWMYLPGAEKQVKISGHMLRQSLMGSDFSYEDMLESPDLSGRYEPTIAGEEPVDGVPCIVLDLKAKVPEITYPERKVWIDKERYVPMKAELYAP
ncbi:MAG: outer membrane lipoprotein-sorting protein [Acidobacteriota bacterium]